MTDRAALVAAAKAAIAKGSQSFAAASMLFAPEMRERAWLLYAWCRAADDMTDGQDLGHDARRPHDPLAAQAQLQALTDLALDSQADVPLPFEALRQVARETGLPRHFVADHLAGFALDAADWRPRSEDDLLRYCYHVAGSVGCMMAVVMGVSPSDRDTLDRASDLGLAFQLANIARDIVPDAEVARCYLPSSWLERFGLREGGLALPENRAVVAEMAARLVRMAQPYRLSARIGAARLTPRARLAVLAADGIYGAIGEKVRDAGASAWDQRIRVSGGGKIALLGQAVLRGLRAPSEAPRTGLWQRPV